MKLVIIFGIIFFSTVLQLTVFSNFFGVGPNLLLLLAILWVIQIGFDASLRRNIFIGLVFDLVTFSLIGAHIASFVLVAFFVSFVSKRFLVVATVWHFLILALIIIFSTVANAVFLNWLFFVMKYFGVNVFVSTPIPVLSLLMLKAIFWNVLFFPMVYFLLRKVERSTLLQVNKKLF